MRSSARAWAWAVVWVVAVRGERRICEDSERGWVVANREPYAKALLAALHGPRCGGLFVECGANNGQNSVTRDIERFVGWRGLCVEAAPSHFKLLKKNRPLCENHNVALWKERSEMVFREYDGGLKDHSGFETMRPAESWAMLEAAHPLARRTEHVVEARPLTDLLGPNRTVVDFFSLDVEGAEMSILRDFPFDRVTVEVWLIESNKLDRLGLVDFMMTRGYACAHVDKINTMCHLVHNNLRHHQPPG